MYCWYLITHSDTQHDCDMYMWSFTDADVDSVHGVCGKLGSYHGIVATVMWSFTDADVDSVQFVESWVVTTEFLPARPVLSLLRQSK